MIYLKLRQRGIMANHKRFERLYAEAQLQVLRRKRKMVLINERQPLTSPDAANEIRSMYFVFDRSAEGRVIKSLTIVDLSSYNLIMRIMSWHLIVVGPTSLLVVIISIPTISLACLA